VGGVGKEREMRNWLNRSCYEWSFVTSYMLHVVCLWPVSAIFLLSLRFPFVIENSGYVEVRSHISKNLMLISYFLFMINLICFACRVFVLAPFNSLLIPQSNTLRFTKSVGIN
jgi:hypothetical protein